jgi:hypothetical protein
MLKRNLMAGSNGKKIVRLEKIGKCVNYIDDAIEGLGKYINDVELDNYERCGIKGGLEDMRKISSDISSLIIYERNKGGFKYVGD